MEKNNLRKIREDRMLSKAELARLAGLSPLTVDRVEKGHRCRMDTKRKILKALGLKPLDVKIVFPPPDEPRERPARKGRAETDAKAPDRDKQAAKDKERGKDKKDASSETKSD